MLCLQVIRCLVYLNGQKACQPAPSTIQSDINKNGHCVWHCPLHMGSLSGSVRHMLNAVLIYEEWQHSLNVATRLSAIFQNAMGLLMACASLDQWMLRYLLMFDHFPFRSNKTGLTRSTITNFIVHIQLCYFSVVHSSLHIVTGHF